MPFDVGRKREAKSLCDMPNFSISLDPFSDITANERFPTLPGAELANLRGKNRNQHTSKRTISWVNVFNDWN